MLYRLPLLRNTIQMMNGLLTNHLLSINRNTHTILMLIIHYIHIYYNRIISTIIHNHNNSSQNTTILNIYRYRANRKRISTQRYIYYYILYTTIIYIPLIYIYYYYIYIYQTRIYKIMMIYDQYYYTPRVFISGVDLENKVLSQEEVMEDIMSEYAHKTVTFEQMSCLGQKMACIHPCKHSEALLSIISVMRANGLEVHPHMVLFIFLKFLNSIMPTLDFDSTMDVYIG